MAGCLVNRPSAVPESATSLQQVHLHRAHVAATQHLRAQTASEVNLLQHRQIGQPQMPTGSCAGSAPSVVLTTMAAGSIAATAFCTRIAYASVGHSATM